MPTTPGTGVYVPPHLNSSYQSNANRNGAATENRYSKDQLLDLFRAQDRPGQVNTNVTDLFVDGWNPMNGANNGGWARKDETKDPSTGPEICWDYEGGVAPLATIEMGEDEKEVFFMSSIFQVLILIVPSPRRSLPLSIRHSNHLFKIVIKITLKIMEPWAEGLHFPRPKAV